MAHVKSYPGLIPTTLTSLILTISGAVGCNTTQETLTETNKPGLPLAVAEPKEKPRETTQQEDLSKIPYKSLLEIIEDENHTQFQHALAELRFRPVTSPSTVDQTLPDRVVGYLNHTNEEVQYFATDYLERYDSGKNIQSVVQFLDRVDASEIELSAREWKGNAIKNAIYYLTKHDNGAYKSKVLPFLDHPSVASSAISYLYEKDDGENMDKIFELISEDTPEAGRAALHYASKHYKPEFTQKLKDFLDGSSGPFVQSGIYFGGNNSETGSLIRETVMLLASQPRESIVEHFRGYLTQDDRKVNIGLAYFRYNGLTEDISPVQEVLKNKEVAGEAIICLMNFDKGASLDKIAPFLKSDDNPTTVEAANYMGAHDTKGTYLDDMVEYFKGAGVENNWARRYADRLENSETMFDRVVPLLENSSPNVQFFALRYLIKNDHQKEYHADVEKLRAANPHEAVRQQIEEYLQHN